MLSRRRILFSQIVPAFFIWWLAGATLGAVNLPLAWRWSNPAPHGNDVFDLAYDGTLGVAVQACDQGQAYVSFDLAAWTPLVTGTSNTLQGAAILPTGRIILTGANGTILYADPYDYAVHPATLPATTDWIEGVDFENSLRLVAVGDNGSTYLSTDGGSGWSKVTVTQNPGNRWLRGVAYGVVTNGVTPKPMFVAVGEFGTIMTSSGALLGTSWTKATSPTAQHLNRVSCIGGIFYIVGENGVSLKSSANGGTWSLEPTGATNSLNTLCNPVNAIRVYAGYSEAWNYRSGSWSSLVTNGFPAWNYLSSFGQNGAAMLGGEAGLLLRASTNGGALTWNRPEDSLRSWLWDVTRAPGFYVAVGELGTILSSGDGVTWDFEPPPASVTNVLLGVAGDTNTIVAVGDSGTIIYSTNALANGVSPNQALWSAVQPPPVTGTLQGIARAKNLFVAAGDNGVILTSPDGIHWSQRAAPTTNTLSSVAAYPGGFVAVGDRGTLLTSPDGKNWTARSLANNTNWLYRARYANGQLVAVGQAGLMVTSANGTNWTARSTGTSAWLNDVAFIQDTWFVVGTLGTVIASTNLTNWSSLGSITGKSLYAAATDGAQLIAVGLEGVILRSPVVPSTAPVNILDYTRTVVANTVYHAFVLGGSTDQRFTLNAATALGGTNWTGDGVLEITDATGLMQYLEANALTNEPPASFFRTRLAP